MRASCFKVRAVVSSWWRRQESQLVETRGGPADKGTLNTAVITPEMNGLHQVQPCEMSTTEEKKRCYEDEVMERGARNDGKRDTE